VDMDDIVIKNGIIIDGSGKEGKKQDLLIKDGVIFDIKDNICENDNFKIIDASNKIVCPGFVDIHRHCDCGVFNENFGEIELRQGITSSIVGNCGLSLTPCINDFKEELYSYLEPCLGRINDKKYEFDNFGEYINCLQASSLPLNIGAMIGTGSIRMSIKGFCNSNYNNIEIKMAQNYIKQSIKDGAFGASLGIMYVPECYTSIEEYVEILSPIKRMGGVATIHIRGEGDSMLKSIQEVIEIGKRAEIPINISHFKSVGMNNWNNNIYKAIELIDNARSKGQNITVDFYPYNGGSTTLVSLLPYEFTEGDLFERINSLKDKSARENLRKMLSKRYDDWDNYTLILGWDRIVISSVTNEYNKKYLSKSISENTLKYGFKDEVEFISELLYDEQGKVGIIVLSMCQEDIDTVCRLPYSFVISDSLYNKTNSPHPRLYGSFPKIIREYVNERKVIDMPTAIKKMTSMPSNRIGLKNKGIIKKNADADILIFDQHKFKDNATYDYSTQLATGLDYAIIGGSIALKDDNIIDEKLGKVLLSGV